MTPDFKIAIIGAGSVGFTKRLVTDILCVPELQDVEFALTDISQHNLAMVQQILDRMVEANRPAHQDHRDHRSARGDRRRTLRHQLRARRRARSLCRRHSHPAEVWRRPVRRRHDLRRRHHVRPAQHPGDARLLQGHPRSRRARRDVPELRQPDGDEHVGGDRIRQGQHHRPVPRRAAGGDADRRGPRRRGRSELDFICSGINHQTWYIDIRLPRPTTSSRTSCSTLSSSTRSIPDRKRSASTCSSASASTPPNRTATCREYLPWYRKRPEEINHWIDMSHWIHGETGGYLRDSHREPQLVRNRLPELPRRGRQADRPGRAHDRARQLHHRGAGDRPRLPRPLQRQEPRPHHQPARRTASSRSPVTSTGSASTWSPA